MLIKLDWKKDLKTLYNPSAKDVSVVDVPPTYYLMIDGSGDPNTSPDFPVAMETLYNVAYTLKFAVKKAGAVDFAVMPLDGLWWVPDMAEFSLERKADWLWTLMIAQPDVVSETHVQHALDEVKRKKNPPALSKLRFERYDEGLCAQIMHIGSYEAEAPTIAKLHAYVHANGYAFRDKHHEIYLGDPRRSAPEKLKTVIRQPIREA